MSTYSYFVGLLVGALCVAFVAFMHWPDSKPAQSVSERINSACPKGYQATDWATDGEFTDIPPDTIKVTCISKDDIKYVAVDR